MLPTLRQLQYLKLLAEHGSFSRAAEAAHVSQPALSAGVQELERILGAPARPPWSSARAAPSS
jgi:LysR family hydrogen peroxide-inducible transcriptional activator